jgi:hypothetical protein
MQPMRVTETPVAPHGSRPALLPGLPTTFPSPRPGDQVHGQQFTRSGRGSVALPAGGDPSHGVQFDGGMTVPVTASSGRTGRPALLVCDECGVCPLAGPDAFGQFDLIEADDCPIHGVDWRDEPVPRRIPGSPRHN